MLTYRINSGLSRYFWFVQKGILFVGVSFFLACSPSSKDTKNTNMSTFSISKEGVESSTHVSDELTGATSQGESTTREQDHKPQPLEPLPHRERHWFEANMKFSHRVEFFSSDPHPTTEMAKEQIEAQLQFLVGALKEAHPAAAPLMDHDITHIRIRRVPRSTDLDHEDMLFEAQYDYRGTIAQAIGARLDYAVPLPRNPGTVWDRSLRRESGLASFFGSLSFREGSTCISDPSERRQRNWFYYFWAPRADGCLLQEGTDFDAVTAYIYPKSMDDLVTYPEYLRLPSRAGKIELRIVMGTNSGSIRSFNPDQSRDLFARMGFLGVRNHLLGLGFQRTSVSENPGSHVEEFEFTTGMVPIHARVFLGLTPRDRNDRGGQPMREEYADALQNGSVIIYSGHSQIGGISLAELEAGLGRPLIFDLNRYQIIFLNGCSSYVHYAREYQSRKRTPEDSFGSKNLDLILNGLETDYGNGHAATLNLVSIIHQWVSAGTALSYPDIERLLDSGNILTVRGSEDNPTDDGDLQQFFREHAPALLGY